MQTIAGFASSVESLSALLRGKWPCPWNYCLEFMQFPALNSEKKKKKSKIRCRSHKLPATVWYDDDDFHKSGIMVLVRREKPSTPPLTQKDCCWQLDTAGLRSSSFILLSFPSFFFSPSIFFHSLPRNTCDCSTSCCGFIQICLQFITFFPPSWMADDTGSIRQLCLCISVCGGGPSYLGHPEWIHLILPWLWHHGSRAHTESH